MIEEKVARELAENHTEYKTASEGEKRLLINAQRFLMSLPFKNRWELEGDLIQAEKKEIGKRNEMLLQTIQKLETDLGIVEHEKREISDALSKAKIELEYAWNKLVLGLKENMDRKFQK